MPNINLKYFIVIILSLSILIIVGAFIFSLIKPASKSTSNLTNKLQQVPSPKQNQATQSAIQNKAESHPGPAGGGHGRD